MTSPPDSAASTQTDRLDSWKEIASYLGRSERTVRRWEEREELPVHRLQHEQRGSVYAYRGELDAWRVSRLKTVEPGPAAAEPAVPAADPVSTRRRIVIWGTATALLLSAAFTVFGLRGTDFRRGGPSSIAVLPFQNLSKNAAEEDWFSDGMTESLIAELARIRNLKVISRTSIMRYKNTKSSLKQIAEELQVDAVVEGSVLRAGDRVRITAQLIQTSTDTHLWARDFDRDLKDVLSVHRDVAESIAREVGAAVTPTPTRAANPQALAPYLKGRYQFNRGALQPALNLARESIRLDPNLAEAHELLGEVLMIAADWTVLSYREAVPEARTALQRVLELKSEPGRGRAYSFLGWTYFVLEHDWAKAERYLRRGFELQPATGNNYAYFLLGQAKPHEAVRTVDRALDYDPANPFALADAALVYHMARQYDDALALYRKAQELSPTMAFARMFEPYTLLVSGRPEQAFERWMWSANGKGPLSRGNEFREAYRTGGWPAVWVDYLKHAQKRGTRLDICALVFLGRREEAIRELESLEQERNSWMIRLYDPVLDPLRQEPRFRALMKRVGYPPSFWQ
jgi:TolB-like protein